MKNENAISFVIPAYNCAGTLTAAVESIFAGNFSPGDEIVIVDDASTDGTPRVIEKIKKRHPEIVTLANEENRGCPASRNIGIAAARNELIFNLDSDNILAPGSIAPLKARLIETAADVAAFGTIRYFTTTPRRITHEWVFPYPELTLADILASHLNPAPAGNFLYKKSLWKRIGGYSEYGKGLHEAWGFSLKVLAAGAKFAILPGGFYFHRYGHDSLFRRESAKKNESSAMAERMLAPHLALLAPESLERMRARPNCWFDALNECPLRLKNGGAGRAGYVARHKRPVAIRFIGKVRSSVRRIVRTAASRAQYYRSWREFKRLSTDAAKRGFSLSARDRKAILGENTADTRFDAHYIYHPAWAARILARERPAEHVDISSTLHFSSILSAFIPVHFYDYRPARLTLDNLTSETADLTALRFEDGSISSLSCMHTVEHIGLGRYGDPLDPDGDIKAIKELKRVLAPGGSLLFVVPIGRPRIVFNAHRIYSYDQIIACFEGLDLKEFSLVPDNGVQAGLIQNASREQANAQRYGCGCFWFKKPKADDHH